ncbi:membrane protein [Clostridium acetobutylicum]|nr:membrane protein [Clostridium acetobutylicum]
MSKKELLKRYIFFLIGLFVNALGVSFITKAKLGTSPISSVPYTLSMGFPLTMGTFTFILNMFLIVGQAIFLGKNFKKVQLMQIPISLVFGYFIDFTMALLSVLNPTTYVFKLVFLLIGCFILALGVSIEVIANVVMLSGEAFVSAISTKFKREFGTIKVCFDITLVVLSIIISLLMFRKVAGVREGTIVAALIVGIIARILSKRLGFINTKILMDRKDLEEEESMVS